MAVMTHNPYISGVHHLGSQLKPIKFYYPIIHAFSRVHNPYFTNFFAAKYLENVIFEFSY
jgi:hypothetical protein